MHAHKCAIVMAVKKGITLGLSDAELCWLAWCKVPCPIHFILEEFKKTGNHGYNTWKRCELSIIHHFFYEFPELFTVGQCPKKRIPRRGRPDCSVLGLWYLVVVVRVDFVFTGDGYTSIPLSKETCLCAEGGMWAECCTEPNPSDHGI